MISVKRKNALAVCALVLLGCAAMTVVDGVLRPPYAVKSAVKLTLFLLAPLLYEYTAGRDGHRALFRIQRRALLRALALGLGVFALILGAFFALRGIQRGKAAHLNRQAGHVAFAAVMQGFELVLQRTVRVAGIRARRRQRMGVNERMERGIRRIMREKAAAVRAQKRIARACVAEGEQKIIRFLRVQQGGDDRRERLAGAEAEEHRVRPLRARQKRAAFSGGIL